MSKEMEELSMFLVQHNVTFGARFVAKSLLKAGYRKQEKIREKVRKQVAKDITKRLREIAGDVDLHQFDQLLDDIELDYGIRTIKDYYKPTIFRGK